ncbi:MAG TPA: NYN domain-containing protein [Gaiellaceae bacterium]
MARVLVDGENVRRSAWPNVSRERLIELAREWAAANGHEVVVVFDGGAPEEADDVVGSGEETADEWIVREAGRLGAFWLVTSDRALRAAAGAERTIGGGAFLRELSGP